MHKMSGNKHDMPSTCITFKGFQYPWQCILKKNFLCQSLPQKSCWYWRIWSSSLTRW